MSHYETHRPNNPTQSDRLQRYALPAADGRDRCGCMKTLIELVDTAQRDLNDSIVKSDIDGTLLEFSLAQGVSRAIEDIADINQGKIRGDFMQCRNTLFWTFSTAS